MYFKSFMMFILLLVLFCKQLCVDCNVEFQIGLKGKQANLDRFDGTCGRKDMKYVMILDSMKFDGTNAYFNYSIVVKENIPDMQLKYIITIKRCLSMENPDSCENFYVYTIKNYCDLLHSDNPLWSAFFATIEPPMRCPIKKGRYRGINCKVGVAAFLMFPANGYYWKVRLEMHRQNGDMLLCALAETQISVTRT